MRVTITHTIDDLERDMRRIATTTRPRLAKIVQKNTTRGNKIAQGIAKNNSGRHGKNYFKRITSEMLSPLEGEYGPHGDVVGNAVGGGWRNGPPNTDLPKSADIIGPAHGKDVGDLLDGLFW